MVISKEALSSGKHGQSVRGVVLIKHYAKKQTKTGKDYIEGQVMNGVPVQFKVWSGSLALSKLLSEDYSNVPTMISGTWDEYMGSLSIVVDDVCAAEGYTPVDFMESPYNMESYCQAIVSLCQKNLSPKCMALANTFIFNNEAVFSRFKEEFAAMGHHDNCKGGLLVHTYKALCLMSWVLRTYDTLLSDGDASTDNLEQRRSDRRDLLMFGTLIHDIGKIDEMQYGVYQPNSAISHRILGLDYLFAHKDEIIATYNEKWYRDLQSIIVEHHDEWADPCRTVVSYVVNRVDVLDAQLTGLCQNIEQKLIEDSTGAKVFMDSKPLSL